jgi:hypothetical protein
MYQFTYFIRGLHVIGNGDIAERGEHVMEVNLVKGKTGEG